MTATEQIPRLKSDFSIYETLARLFLVGLNSKEKYPSLERVRDSSSYVHAKVGNSCPSRAVTARKCTKKRDARAELLFC